MLHGSTSRTSTSSTGYSVSTPLPSRHFDSSCRSRCATLVGHLALLSEPRPPRQKLRTIALHVENAVGGSASAPVTTGRKKRMKEPHIEEVANHDDPESCVGVREGTGEALTGARAGWVLSREITQFGAPTALADPEGNTHGCDIASARVALRGRRLHARTESSCTGTGRSLRRSARMARRDESGRPVPSLDQLCRVESTVLHQAEEFRGAS